MTTLKTGDTAPAFALQDANNNTINLKNLKGKWVLLYFYPKASTPGCTTQACDIRDNMTMLQNSNIYVAGVSPDAPAKLKKFAEAQALPFTLLSDPDHTIAETYNVWVEKSMYGKKYMGVERTSYLIDPEGKIATIFKKVSPKQHIAQITSYLKTK